MSEGVVVQFRGQYSWGAVRIASVHVIVDELRSQFLMYGLCAFVCVFKL